MSAPAPVAAAPVAPPQPRDKAVIKIVDMSDEDKNEVIDLAVTALDKFSSEKEMASFIKQSLDKKHKSTWHVIVGRNFGGFCQYAKGYYIYFYLAQVGFLIWKSA